MLLRQLSWLAARCLGVRASEARLSRQTDRGGGNPIVQPSPSLMSVYPAIYPCVYLSDWLLDTAYLHAGYSSGFPSSSSSRGAPLAAELICFRKVSPASVQKKKKLVKKNKSSYLWITDVAAGLTSAGSPPPLSPATCTEGGARAGCDNIRIMRRHVWRARDGGAGCVCIWCGGRKLLYNEEGCQDMRWEVGSWRQDISYEKGTNAGKRRRLLLWLYKLKCILLLSLHD